MKPITRLWCLAMMCALLATFFSTPTARAADVEPLRSADLESRLKSAGFDDAQRAKILADYAAYVQRYSTSVAALIIEWQGLAGVQPSLNTHATDSRRLENREKFFPDPISQYRFDDH